jgi:type II secretory pathway component PulC
VFINLEAKQMSLQRLLLLGNIALSALVVWAGVSIIITFISNWHSAEPALSVPSKMSMPKDHSSSKDRRLEDYALIVSKDVFHTVKGTARITGKKQVEDIGETELNLELRGTVLGEGKESRAFILDEESGEEAVYYAGDYVMGNQILKIMKDRVILNVGGKEEALLLETLNKKKTQAAFKPGEKSPTVPLQRPAIPPQRRIIPPRRGGGTSGG